MSSPPTGVDLVVLELDPEQVSEFVDRHPRGHPVPPAAQRLDVRGLPVVLVADLPDELLDQVLERDEAGDPAVLVDDHGEVDGLQLHVAQQVVRLLRFRREERGARERRSRGAIRGTRALVQLPGEGP